MPSYNLGDAIRNATPSVFTPIPKGNYNVVVESAEYVFSKAGNPMFNLTLVVEDSEGFDGRKLWSRVVFTEKSVSMAVDQMRALGIDQDLLAQALSDNGDPAEVCRLLVDAPAVAKVEVDDSYDGTPRNNVKRLIARPDSGLGARVPVGAGAGPAAAARPNRPF